MTRAVKTIIPFVAVIAICLLVEPVRSTIEQLVFLFHLGDVEALKNYIRSFGIWAPVISFALMLFQSLIAPLPAFLITFSNAAIFGWVMGALLSWTSAMAGAALCFAISRWFGREVTERLASRMALKEIDQFFKQYGQYTILIARLLPFVSFDLVSYAAGLTSMSFWSFFWATGLGQLPATLIYSYAGEMLSGTTQKFVLGLLLIFAVSVLLVFIKKVRLQKLPLSSK